MLPPPGFHHLHLNSVDPDAAIEFYVRHFPTSAKTRWAGLPALAAPNDVLVLFTQVATPRASSTAGALGPPPTATSGCLPVPPPSARALRDRPPA